VRFEDRCFLEGDVVYVCVCVCVCVCVNVCMYLCLYVCTYVLSVVLGCVALSVSEFREIHSRLMMENKVLRCLEFEE